MAQIRRGSIINQIPNLQLEWATEYPSLSIRDFLIEKRGFTDRQYRFILSRAPAEEWKKGREEIQNRMGSQKIDGFLADMRKTQGTHSRASHLALARSVGLLAKKELKPTDLLNCIRSVEVAQRIFHTAMGIREGYGLQQIDKDLLEHAAQSRAEHQSITLETYFEQWWQLVKGQASPG